MSSHENRLVEIIVLLLVLCQAGFNIVTYIRLLVYSRTMGAFLLVLNPLVIISSVFLTLHSLRMYLSNGKSIFGHPTIMLIAVIILLAASSLQSFAMLRRYGPLIKEIREGERK